MKRPKRSLEHEEECARLLRHYGPQGFPALVELFERQFRVINLRAQLILGVCSGMVSASGIRDCPLRTLAMPATAAPAPTAGRVRASCKSNGAVVVDVAVGGAGVAHDGRRVAQRGQRERQVGPAGRDRHDGHLRARTGGDEGTTERGPRVG